MKKFLLAMVLVLVSLDASAARNLGRWLCPDCNLGVSGTDAAVGLGEALAFIKANKITKQYQPNDVITVCDGATCIVVTYQSSGVFLAPGVTYPDDPKLGYKNGKSGGVSSSYNGSSTTAAYYAVQAWGHYEWWDYYSDGVYIGSSEPEWIIDGYTVTYTPKNACVGSSPACMGNNNNMS